MENLKTLSDRIKKFYGLVETHNKEIEICVKETVKPCNSIVNQSSLLRAVIQENLDLITGFEELPGYKEALTENIFRSLEEEFHLLEEIRDKIDALNETLFIEQKSIERIYGDLREKKLIDHSKLNPCSPSLENVVAWCCDVWRHYHSFYLQVFQALNNLQYENEESVNILPISLKENLDSKKIIDKIRSFDFANFEFISQ